MRIKTILTILITLIASSINAQQRIFDFNDDVEKVKQNISLLVKNGSTEQEKYIWDNGRLIEITYIEYNIVAFGLPYPLTARNRYIFQNGKLSKIVKEYFSLSLQELKRLRRKNSVKENIIDDFYFNSDYSVCTKIILSNNNLAATETCPTNLERFSPNVKNAIIAGRKRNAEFEKLRPLKELQSLEEEKTKQEKFKSNIFTIKPESREYNLFKDDLKRYIKLFFQEESKSKNFPGDTGCFEFKNIYKCKYVLQFLKKSSESGKYLTTCLSDNQLIKGNDTDLHLFSRQWNAPIKTIEIAGEPVLTEVEIDSVDVFFMKGVASIKIKNGVLTYIYGSHGNEYLSEALRNYLVGKSGKYKVEYEFGSYLGESYQKITHKIIH